MICPRCAKSAKVIDSRPHRRTRWRKRECRACRYRWDTIETLHEGSHSPRPILVDVLIDAELAKGHTVEVHLSDGRVIVWSPGDEPTLLGPEESK